MRPLRLVLLVCAVGLVAAGSALADHQDPKKRITPADQSRARAMLVKAGDLRGGFVMQQPGGADPHVDCPRSVSEADLTLTGDIDGPQFVQGTVSVGSAAQVFESRADSAASWRRANSAAGLRCATNLLRREFAKEGVALQSLRKIAFPRVAERTAVFRVTLSITSPQGAKVPLFVDLVALAHSRAQAQVIVGSALAAPNRAEELHLARLVAGRMARAMRGG